MVAEKTCLKKNTDNWTSRKKDLPPKVRWFVMTDWNMNSRESYEKICKEKNIKFFAWGEEICPKSGKPHNQCFMYFKNPRKWDNNNLNKMADWWGPIHNFCDAQVFDESINAMYCSKEHKYHEIGTPPSQGKRGDLDEIKESILEGGTTVDDICVESPHLFHQYGRTLERLEIIAMRRKFRYKQMTEGIWITGRSGFGKSHHCFEGFDPATHFLKDLTVEWWDGYKQQDVVIFNEFRGHHMRWSDLLAIVDEWPHNVKWRGKESVPFISKKVIITSVLNPIECYKGKQNDEEWEQFFRRFKVYEIPCKEGTPVQLDISKLEQMCSEGNIKTSEPSTPFNSPIWDF